MTMLILSAPFSFGQREKNNIYLFDCTGSMKTNGLWDPAKSALEATIDAQTDIPNSQFSVIPFGDNPYENITFNSTQYVSKKSYIENAFKKYINQAKYTHISEAIKAGLDRIDTSKDNKLYLLTDGMPNGGDSADNVAKVITAWCANHRNCRLFYVALTKGVINPVIQRAINACPDAFIIQCEDGIIPQIADISPNDVHTNIEELSVPQELNFSLPGKYDICVESTDSLFDVLIDNNSTADGKIRISLGIKGNLNVAQLHQKLAGCEYHFPARLQCSDNMHFIANPDITIHVTDEVPSKLTFAQGFDELQTDGVHWHDSFLWNDAAPETKAVWDLAPVFRNELLDSQLCLEFNVAENQAADFQAWYNGQPINPSSIIKIEPYQPAILEVLFNYDASTGKRYFTLTHVSSNGVNLINEQPAEDFASVSLRTQYSVGWNPLKTILFSSCIILLAALFIWVFILRRIFFPTIKLSRITITGPSSYYASKKIKGAYKVILTSKRRSQNMFSRVFVGEKRFIRADHFSTEIAIIAAGGKKKVKFQSDRETNTTWEFYPSTIFGQFDKGTLSNRTTNEKSEIEFS